VKATPASARKKPKCSLCQQTVRGECSCVHVCACVHLCVNVGECACMRVCVLCLSSPVEPLEHVLPFFQGHSRSSKSCPRYNDPAEVIKRQARVEERCDKTDAKLADEQRSCIALLCASHGTDNNITAMTTNNKQ
jgi:hypothetical protein